jgi:hypothetical protein
MCSSMRTRRLLSRLQSADKILLAVMQTTCSSLFRPRLYRLYLSESRSRTRTKKHKAEQPVVCKSDMSYLTPSTNLSRVDPELGYFTRV